MTQSVQEYEQQGLEKYSYELKTTRTMKTAVEWLEKEVNQYGILTKGLVLNLLSQAKEMDKQAHKETWDVAHQAGRFEGKGIAEENWQTFEEYWDETF